MSLELIVTNRVVDLVGEGVDLAIRSQTAMRDSSLIARRFFEVSSQLWASLRYLREIPKPSHPTDLEGAAFVTNPARGSLMLTDGRFDFELQMNGRVQSEDYETIKALCVLGEGIAWLPDYLVADLVAAGALVPVLPEWRPKNRASFYFVYPSRQYALPKVEAFIQTALALEPQHRWSLEATLPTSAL